MKLALFLFCAAIPLGPAWGLLGDTRDQAEARHGLEKREGIKQFQVPLLQGAKEITFEYGAWTVRCVLLKATDGNDYIIREEYRKLWNTAVFKAGGTLTIRDFERDSVFQAEGANLWVQRKLGDPGNDSYSSLLNQYARLAGISGTIWTRQDGAIARCDSIGNAITFDLPQAMKYEIDLKRSTGGADREEATKSTGVMPQMNRSDPITVLPQSSAPKASGQPTAQYLLARIQPLANSAPIPSRASATLQSVPPLNRQSAFAPIFGGLFVAGLFGGVLTILVSLAKQSGREALPGRRNGTPRRIEGSLPNSPKATRRSFNDLTWDEFELLVGRIYQRKGYQVTLSAGTGADGGIDLTLFKGSEKILVQCKSWNVYKVGPKEIREFFGVLVSEGAQRGIFVTTGNYTRDALDFARGKAIEMIDGPQLEALIRDAFNRARRRSLKCFALGACVPRKRNRDNTGVSVLQEDHA